MPLRRVILTPEQDAFVTEAVRAGKYRNVSEAMRDALGALQARIQAEEADPGPLKTQLQAGLDALSRGDFSEFDDESLDDGLDALLTAPTP